MNFLECQRVSCIAACRETEN